MSILMFLINILINYTLVPIFYQNYKLLPTFNKILQICPCKHTFISNTYFDTATKDKNYGQSILENRQKLQNMQNRFCVCVCAYKEVLCLHLFGYLMNDQKRAGSCLD